jgi:TPR repeat protein
MALIACYECGKQVSSDAPACPQCGAPQKQLLEPPTIAVHASPTILSFSGHIREELIKLSRVDVRSIVAWIGYGFFIPSIIIGGNPFGALICFVFGVISFRAWCGRRTIRIILKRQTLENYTSRAYLPALWSYLWRSCVTFVTIALIIAFASVVTTEERIRAITAVITIWLLPSLFTLDVPFWIRRKVERVVRIQNAHSVSSEVPSSLIRPVLFVALFVVALGFWIVLNKEGSLFNNTPSIAAESPPNVTAGGVVATQDKEAHSSRPMPTPQIDAELSQTADSVAALRAKAEDGVVTAQYNLGIMFYIGSGVEKNEAEAVKWFRKAADQGNADAQAELGAAYANGSGLQKDDFEGVKWFRKAADQGHAVAQYNLGIYYTNGIGVAKDEVEGVNWIRKAAEQGDPDAQVAMSSAYHFGRGVPKDEVEGLKWLCMAADQGHALAQNNLGYLYANGKGVQYNAVSAYMWTLLAAAQGFEPAKEAVSKIAPHLTPAQRSEGERKAREFKPRSVVPSSPLR